MDKNEVFGQRASFYLPCGQSGHMPSPENRFVDIPDEVLPDAFRMAVFAENWDLRDDIFHELDRRRLGAMDDPAREEELQFRARFEQIEGEPFVNRALRISTIALIGSPEERQVAFDSIIHSLQRYRPDGNIQFRIESRTVPYWRKFFNLDS